MVVESYSTVTETMTKEGWGKEGATNLHRPIESKGTTY